MFDEKYIRTGFLHDEQYQAVMDECTKAGIWIRAMVEIYATFAWRKREILGSLKVHQVDLKHRTIRLDDSKNGDGRLIHMTAKIFELISVCVHGKRLDEYVFTREGGSPVLDFRGTWAKVTAAAGCPNLLIHDLRRTGARNMRRLGIHEDTIMKIGGWRTRSVFMRYNITDESDLKEAATRLNEFSQSLAKVTPEIGATPSPSESANVGRIN